MRARQSWDFALAGVALVLTFKGSQVETAKVVLSGTAPIPWRCKEAEEVITGRPLDSNTIRRAAEAATRNAQPLKHNGYKVPLLRGVMEEELSRIARA